MDVVVASTEADLGAVEAIKAHHAQLAGALAARVGAVQAEARAGQDAGARAELVRWAEAELLPHAAAEEETVYAAAARTSDGRLLVEALVADHVVIKGMVTALSGARDLLDAAVTAAALQSLFAAHMSKENDQILPLLAGHPDVSLAGLLEGMHDELGGPAQHAHQHAPEGDAVEQSQAGCGGNCTCGEQDAASDVELDAREVPHAIRHATVFGALDGLPDGKVLVLVAPHDPVPLLRQIEQRRPGMFEVDYVERGPEAWRLRFRRREQEA